MPHVDFTAVTEHPGDPATEDQIARLYDRYRFAATQARGGRVLEVACGSGIGLPYLARHASALVGGDIDAEHVQSAARHGLPIVRLDAGHLPFRDDAFDLIFIGEAVYYLPDVERVLGEVARVLRAGGRIAVTTVNPRWPGWVGSSHSVRYHDHAELSRLLSAAGFSVTAYGAFPDRGTGRLTAQARKILVRLKLVPGSLKARALLKRVVYGRLSPLPSEIVDLEGSSATWTRLQEDEAGERFSILHIVGVVRKPD